MLRRSYALALQRAWGGSPTNSHIFLFQLALAIVRPDWHWLQAMIHASGHAKDAKSLSKHRRDENKILERTLAAKHLDEVSAGGNDYLEIDFPATPRKMIRMRLAISCYVVFTLLWYVSLL